MALLQRFSRLIKADFHAVLDHLEDPELLLRQAAREMEAVLDELNGQLDQLKVNSQQNLRRHNELNQLIATLDGELDVCFQSDHPDLAKSQIRRKLDAQNSLRTVSENQTALGARSEQLAQQIADKTLRLEGIKQKIEVFGQSDTSVNDFEVARVTDEEVELHFLKEQRKRSQGETSQ